METGGQDCQKDVTFILEVSFSSACAGGDLTSDSLRVNPGLPYHVGREMRQSVTIHLVWMNEIIAKEKNFGFSGCSSRLTRFCFSFFFSSSLEIIRSTAVAEGH